MYVLDFRCGSRFYFCPLKLKGNLLNVLKVRHATLVK